MCGKDPIMCKNGDETGACKKNKVNVVVPIVVILLWFFNNIT